jgi:hypothetical protein
VPQRRGTNNPEPHLQIESNICACLMYFLKIVSIGVHQAYIQYTA